MRRRDRHARGHRPRVRSTSSRPSRSGAPTVAIKEGRFDRSLVPVPQPRRHRRARPRGVPAARARRSSRSARSPPSFAAHGRLSRSTTTARRYRDGAQPAYPDLEIDARPPRRQLLGRRRRRGRDAATPAPSTRAAHGLTPRARIVASRQHGRRPDADAQRAGARGPQGARQGRADARRHRPLRDQRGLRRRAPRSSSATSTSTATRSTSTAAPWRSATRSAPPARC